VASSREVGFSTREALPKWTGAGVILASLGAMVVLFEEVMWVEVVAWFKFNFKVVLASLDRSWK
jgi:hypothetical protein